MDGGIFSKITLVFNEVFIGMILLVVVPTALLGVVASGNLSLVNILGGAFLIAALQISSNVLNNYADWEIDEVNRKRTEMHKMIRRGALPLIALVPMLVTVPFFVYGNIYLKIVMVIAYLIVINYNLLIKAKDILLLNYAFIAFGYGPLAFAIGFFFSSSNLNIFNNFFWIPLFIFCMNMGFVVIKDYGDVEGDKKLNKMTLPVVFGKRFALLYQFLLTTVVFAGMIYFGVTKLNWASSVFLVVPYLIALYAIKKVASPKNSSAYSRASNIIRLNALIAVAILFLYFISPLQA